jgi:hypothetical protein
VKIKAKATVITTSKSGNVTIVCQDRELKEKKPETVKKPRRKSA